MFVVPQVSEIVLFDFVVEPVSDMSVIGGDDCVDDPLRKSVILAFEGHQIPEAICVPGFGFDPSFGKEMVPTLLTGKPFFEGFEIATLRVTKV